MSKTQQPVLLTVVEVASLLRIHRPKVYDLIKAGTIEGFKLGSDWRIRRQSVEQLIGPIPEDFFEKQGKRNGEVAVNGSGQHPSDLGSELKGEKRRAA